MTTFDEMSKCWNCSKKQVKENLKKTQGMCPKCNTVLEKDYVTFGRHPDEWRT